MAPETDDDLLGLDPEALARAEAALDSLSPHYLSWAEADMARLRAALAELSADPSWLARLFTIAHDMKGQAATFGYPLVTTIGERLCRFIDEHPTPTPDADALARMTALVEAMGEVLAQRMAGDGGAAGRALLARLDA
ncbi:MAG: Hpt domain-containing protein [Rhodospirillaceae bacterium]|nr:Hpt domain-containing protein [Rhodospirillales bacterium]